ncbi:phospholipase D family protein [Klebsiella pneumoniae]|nr:phospholipase D family protein [Klebsiella pneumoniae]
MFWDSRLEPPEGSARVLVLSAIDSAKTSIRMMAYSFTAPDIMKALVAAKKRGVDVKIVIDERGNTGRASIAAMNYIANSGIPLRTDSDFPIQHDKVIIVDNVTVETGSFNWHCCKVSDEAAFCLIQRPYISKTLLTRRISPRGSP